MTSLDFPVVPEVGIITAGSSGAAGPGPSGSRSAASSARSTTSLGSSWSRSPASSEAVLLGLVATAIAPR